MTSCSFKAPNGQNSLLYTNLSTLVGDDRATQTWNYVRSQEFADKYLKGQTYGWLENTFKQDLPGLIHYLDKVLSIPTDTNGEPAARWIQKELRLAPTQEVKYLLKSVEILNSDKAAQVFKAADKGQWPIEKILKELQIPPAQRELILSFNTRNREEILTNLMANYSYAVEVETVTNRKAQSWMTPDELADIEPSDNYSNLTVPGGTNYTENEIRTPDITYSIKGHAAFATDQGIGWFRSDEQRIGKGEYTLTQLKEKFPEKFDEQGNFQYTKLKTRRILEVQSDLFQKGRDENNLIQRGEYFIKKYDDGTAVIYSGSLYGEPSEPYDQYNSLEEAEEELRELNKIPEKDRASNQFLQLLNKDNNWVTFFVKAIIQDSAKKGYEKVLFPTGDTAAKVEGHQTLATFISQGESIISQSRDRIKVASEAIKDVEGGHIKHTNPKAYIEHQKQIIKDQERTIEIHQQELDEARASTFKVSFIAKFYEDTIKNILDKRGYKTERIKDEHGNEWYEVAVADERDLQPLSLAAQKGRKLFPVDLSKAKVSPAQSKWLAKDQYKSDNSTAFIGRGTGATGEYLRLSKAASKPSNSGKYTANDIVFISANGSRKGAVEPDFDEIQKAIKAKAQFLTDARSRRPEGGNAYNIGEQKVAELLRMHGYIETEENNGLVARWNPLVEVLAPVSLIINADLFGTATKRVGRVPYDEALGRVENIYQQAVNNPTGIFDLSIFKAEGLRKAQYGGYTPSEVANLFASYPIPTNITFDTKFEQLILSSPSYQRAHMELRDISFLGYSEAALRENVDKLFVPIKDEQGNKTGKNFTSDQQIAAIDTIVAVVWKYFKADDQVRIGELLRVGGTVYNELAAFSEKFEKGLGLPSYLSQEKATIQSQNIKLVLNSWLEFVGRALYKLESYGLKSKGANTKEAISSILENGEEIYEEEAGRGLLSWEDSSFELDPRDTASTRIKLFLASIRDVEYGEEREPVTISFHVSDKKIRDRILGKDPIAGAKTISIRTPEYLEKIGVQMGRQYIAKIDNTKFRVNFERALTTEDLSNETIKANAAEEGVTPKVGDVLVTMAPWKPVTGVVRTKENFLGFSQLVDFDTLFQEILEITSGTPNTIENYTNALLVEGKNFRPVLVEVANQLAKLPSQLQREFVKVMSKQYSEFTILLHSKRRDGFLDMTPINANSGSAVNSILKQWQENQKHAKMVVEDDLGNLVINQQLAQNFYNELTQIYSAYQSDTLPNRDNVLKPFAKRLFEANGISIPDAAFDYLFDNMTKLTKNTSVAGGLKEQFGFTAEGIPTGIFSTIVMTLNGLTDAASEEEQRSYLINNNPLYSETTTMKLLARIAYKFSPKTAAGSHMNSEGKNIYAFTMNSHLSTSIRKLKTDATYRQTLLGTLMGKSNWLLDLLINQPEERDNLQLQYVDGLKESYKKNSQGIVRPQMSGREQLVYILGNFQRQGRDTANYLSLTHSDKSATPLFSGLKKFVLSKEGIGKQAEDAVYQTIFGEFERIKLWYKTTKEQKNVTANDSFNRGGGYFYFVPQLNYDNMAQMVKEGKLSQDELQTVWAGKGIPNMHAGAVMLKRVALKIYLNEWLVPEIDKMYERLDKEGFFTKTLIDHSYFIKNLHNTDVVGTEARKGEWTYHDAADGSSLSEEDAVALFYDQFGVKDILVNYFLNNTALSALIYGDPALTFKGKEGDSDSKAVEKTMIEYSKRLAGDIAPGQDLTWEKGPKETYKTVTLLDDERVHKYLEHLEKYRGQDINGTDAEEFTTVAEHLYVMRSAGLIDEKIYQEMKKIVEDGMATKDGYYEFSDKKHLDVVMQIMKPVYVSHSFDEVPGVATMQYVKSSSIPLYPPLTKYFEIDALRRHMEKNGIQRGHFISAKKMGAPAGKGAKIFDKDGNLDINLDNLSKYEQTLTREGFRIQQEVPYNEEHNDILTGSQSNKLFIEGIDELSFSIPGFEKISGKELKQLKEDTRKAMVALQHQQFIDKTGAIVVGDRLMIKDKAKLLGLLEEEAISRSYPPNDLELIRRTINSPLPTGEIVKELAIPLFFNPSANRFESLLLSLVKKIGQIHLPGKSYIQATSAGFKFKQKLNFEDLDSVSKQNIVWMSGYEGNELQTMTKGKPGEVLLPFNFFITNSSGEQVRVNPMDYALQDPTTKRWNIDPTRIPQELLEHILFRIPTQKHNSMLPVRVVGFIPHNMGDTIIVPAAITMQMGSDFDVDKLYTYRRPYTYDRNAKTFSVVPAGEGNMDALASRYFDIFWAVLNHPEMYETVLQPLDKPDLRNEAARATQGAMPANYYSILTQADDYLSQKDAKIMVGISSLFVTFNTLLEGRNLYVGSLMEAGTYTDDEEGQPESTDTYQPDGVRFIPEGTSEAKHAYELSKDGIADYYEEDVNKPDSKKVLKRSRIDSQVTFQSAFLDHAKEKVIDKLNINLQTVYAAFAATAIVSPDGKRMSEKHIALLLRQPSVLEYVDKLSRSQDSFSDEFNPNLAEDLLESSLFTWAAKGGVNEFHTIDELKQYISKDHDFDVISIDKLKEGLAGGDTYSYFLQQAGALKAFARLNEIGRAMGDLQRTLSQDPRGPGKDMTVVLQRIEERGNLKDNGVIANADQLLDSEQGYIHHVELDTARDAYKELLPYEGFSNILFLVKDITGRRTLSSQTIKDIVSDFKSFIFSDSKLGLSDNPSYDRYRLLYGTRDEKSLAARIWEAQQTSKNYFLKRLSPQQGDNVNTPSYVFYLASRASALDDQENTAAFLELLTSSNENEKKIGEDLIRYAYLTGGVSGSFSFIKYIPAEALVQLPFAAELREINRRLANPESVNGFDYDFLEQWVQHNPAMMKKIPAGYNEHVGEKFTLPLPSKAVNDATLRPLLDKLKGSYPDYLSHYNKEENQWMLFKKDRSTSNSYIRIDTLGNSYSTEYAKDNGFQQSIFIDNKALISPEGLKRYIQLDEQVPDDEIFNTPGVQPWKSIATSQLGITKDNYSKAETEELIKKLSSNDNIVPSTQMLFKEIGSILAKSTNKISIQIAQDEKRPFTAATMSESGQMTIVNTNYATNEFAGILVHELMHGLLLPYTYSSTSNQQKFPEVYQSLQEITEIMEEARASIIKEASEAGYTEEKLNEILIKNQTGVRQDNDQDINWAALMYSVSNINEFTSHILEDKKLQWFLSTQTSQYAGSTLFDRIIDWFAKFLKELSKYLSVDIESQSQLAVGLKRTFNLLDEIRAAGDTIKRPSTQARQIANTYFNGIYSASGVYIVNDSSKAMDIITDISKEFPSVEVFWKKLPDETYQITIPNTLPLGFSKVVQPSEGKEITNPIDRIYSKVQEQMQDISSSIAKNKKDIDVLRQRALLRELRALNNDLKATQDLNRIVDLAGFQIDWAIKIKEQFKAGQKPVTINQVMTATRLLSVWSNLLNLMYNGVSDQDVVYDEEFVKLEGEAKNLLQDFHNQIIPQVFKKLASTRVETADFLNISDMGNGTARFLSVERAKDKVTQEVALTIQNTHRAYLTTGQELVKRLADFEADMKKLASKKGLKVQNLYEQFFQDGPDWGLVTKYSPEFFRWKSGLRKRLNDTIDNIEKTTDDNVKRKSLISAAYSRYWRALDQRAGFIDIRKIFSEEAKDLGTEASKKYIKTMEDEYGKEFTSEVVEEARKLYETYILDKANAFEILDGQVEDSLMTEAEAEEEKAAWDIENSPVAKMDSRAISPSSPNNMNEKYLVLVPHKTAKGFSGDSMFDPKYAKIQKDANMLTAYNKIQAFMEEFTKNLPFFLEHKFTDSFLPAIKSRLINDIAGAINYVKGAPGQLIDSLTANSYEEFMQNRTTREIPILYLENPFEDIAKPQKNTTPEQRKEYEAKRKERASEYSRNLPRVLELFGLMSYHYKYFSEAKDAIDLGTEVLKKADKDMQSNTRMVEKNGKVTSVTASLKNTLGALEYTKDVLMYKRTRDLEGKLGERVKKLDKSSTDTLKSLRIQQEELDAKLENNEITALEHDTATKAIDEKLKNFKISNYYASKAGYVAITWTQMKSLSYNPFSAINNLGFGLISASIHANGGQDYGWKEFRRAFADMMSATGRSLGLARLTGNNSVMSKKAEKILNVMDRMGIMGELTDSEYGKSNIKAPLKGIRSALSPYQMLRTGDYFAKGLPMIAVLRKEKITIDGKEMSVWDAIETDGHIKGAGDKWENSDPRVTEDWNKLRNKVISVVKIIMGNQDKSSPISAKKKILWNLVGQFRMSWLSEGIASRFEDERDDIQLGRIRKGRYRTYGDLGFLQSIGILLKQMLSAVPFVKIDPYTGAKMKNGKEMSATDKANMRRNLAEISWFLLLYGSAMLIGAAASGDDEDKKKKYRFLANMAIRSYQDVGLYGSPSILDSVLGNIVPASSTIKDTMAFFGATGKYLMNDDYTSEQWFLKLTKAGFIPQTTLINRYKTMTEKDLSNLAR